MLAVAVERHQLPRLAIPEPLQEFDAAVTVPAHQSHAHLEVLRGGLGSQFDDAPRARTIHRHRLLHERVHALLDSVRKLRCTKCRRSGKQRDVARPEAVDRLPIGFEADEHPLIRHVDPFLELLAERPLDDIDPVPKYVGHRHHLDRRSRHGERIDRGTAAPSAAADQRHADLIRAGGMNMRNRPAGEERARQGDRPGRCGSLGDCAQKRATGGAAAQQAARLREQVGRTRDWGCRFRGLHERWFLAMSALHDRFTQRAKIRRL